MERVDKGGTNSVVKLRGRNNEEKPTLTKQDSGTTFYYVDTGDVYEWHVDQWYVI